MYYFVFFIFCFLISSDVGRSKFLGTRCDNESAYNVTTPSGSLYRRNVVSLYSVLYSNGTQPNGFYNYTVGGGNGGPAVYGLFLCRGDSTGTECQVCLNLAITEILQTCSNVTRAITWYDECMLRHSDLRIFSQVDPGDGYRFSEDKNYTDGALLNRTLGEVFDKIITEAAYGEVPGKKFAVAEANLTEFTKMFGLGQCTPDLSDLDCEFCLRDTITSFPKCCNNRPGGSVVRPSCNVRYSLTPFYHSVDPPSSPRSQPTPPPPAVGGEFSTATVSAIVSPVMTTASVAFALAFIIVCL